MVLVDESQYSIRQSATELVFVFKIFWVLCRAKQIFLARCCARYVKIFESKLKKCNFVCLQTVFGLCVVWCLSEKGKMQCNYYTVIIVKPDISLLGFVW